MLGRHFLFYSQRKNLNTALLWLWHRRTFGLKIWYFFRKSDIFRRSDTSLENQIYQNQIHQNKSQNWVPRQQHYYHKYVSTGHIAESKSVFNSILGQNWQRTKHKKTALYIYIRIKYTRYKINIILLYIVLMYIPIYN